MSGAQFQFDFGRARDRYYWSKVDALAKASGYNVAGRLAALSSLHHGAVIFRAFLAHYEFVSRW